MNITQAPGGGFYIARYKNLAVFDRNRDNAMARLLRAIWPMPPANYFTEDVSASRNVQPIQKQG